MQAGSSPAPDIGSSSGAGPRRPSAAETLALWKIIEVAHLVRARLAHMTPVVAQILQAASPSMAASTRARAIFIRLGGRSLMRRLRAKDVAAWRARQLTLQRNNFALGLKRLRDGHRDVSVYSFDAMPNESWRAVRRHRPTRDQVRTRDRLAATADRQRAQLRDVEGGSHHVRPTWTTAALRPGERRWHPESATWEVWDTPMVTDASRPVPTPAGAESEAEQFQLRQSGAAMGASLTLAAFSPTSSLAGNTFSAYGVPLGWRLARGGGAPLLAEFVVNTSATGMEAGWHEYVCDFSWLEDSLPAGGQVWVVNLPLSSIGATWTFGSGLLQGSRCRLSLASRDTLTSFFAGPVLIPYSGAETHRDVPLPSAEPSEPPSRAVSVDMETEEGAGRTAQEDALEETLFQSLHLRREDEDLWLGASDAAAYVEAVVQAFNQGTRLQARVRTPVAEYSLSRRSTGVGFMTQRQASASAWWAPEEGLLGAMVWWEGVRVGPLRQVAFVTEFAADLWARGYGVAMEVWKVALGYWEQYGITEVHLWVRTCAAQQHDARNWYARQGFRDSCPAPIREPLESWVAGQARTYLWAPLATLVASAGSACRGPQIERMKVEVFKSYRGLRTRRAADIAGERLFQAIHGADGGDGCDLVGNLPRGRMVGLAYGWAWFQAAEAAEDPALGTGSALPGGSSDGAAPFCAEDGAASDMVVDTGDPEVALSPAGLVRVARAQRRERMPRPSPIGPPRSRRASVSSDGALEARREAWEGTRDRVAQHVRRGLFPGAM